MGKLKRMLEANTLVETIVSMMLIVLIMGIVMQSMIQVKREVGSDWKPYVSSLIKNNLVNLPATEGYTEINDEFSSLTVIKRLTKYEGYEDLYLFEVRVIDTNAKTVAFSRKVISSYQMNKQYPSDE